MSLFLHPVVAVTEVLVVSFWVVRRVPFSSSPCLSLTLFLSALEGLLLAGRTSVAQLFENSSLEQCGSSRLGSSSLCLQHLSLHVCLNCRQQRRNAILSSLEVQPAGAGSNYLRDKDQ